ncbi:MAG: alpha/beta hydrolase [Myxococcaceae bacterium]
MRTISGAVVESFASSSPGQFLLLHGNPGSRETFAKLAPLLTGLGEVAALDLPGFGESADPPGGAKVSVESHAQTVIAVAEDLGWKSPVLVGHSHGGGVALVAAALAPERFSGVVLVASLGFPAHFAYRLLNVPLAHAVMSAAGHALRLPGARLLLELNMRRVFAPERVDPSRAAHELAFFTRRPATLRHMVDLARGAPSELLHRLAPEVRCPALVIHGVEDALVPLACARAIHERLPKSQFIAVERAGHMLPEQQPELLARQIANWRRGAP